MSHVTDIILVTMIEDSEGVAQLNAWLEANHGFPHLKEISDHAGGNKGVQADVWMAAINYMDIPAFVAAFKAAPWQFPECAQLMLKDEHEERFTVYLPAVLPPRR
jgi:hypothetical protein